MKETDVLLIIGGLGLASMLLKPQAPIDVRTEQPLYLVPPSTAGSSLLAPPGSLGEALWNGTWFHRLFG